MRTALIGPAIVESDPRSNAGPKGYWGGYEPPLGVLTLASSLRNAGFQPLVFELDGFLRDHLTKGAGSGEAFELAAQAIGSLDAEVLGFGTICGSYPLTIRLAKRVQQLRPDARVVLGGPQASATDIATLEAFPFVHAVIRGEVDEIAAAAFDEISRNARVCTPGVTWRNGDRIVANAPAPVVLNLDAIPGPAFDLCEYIDRGPRFSVEIGRGCPFACTFCSTNDFFRRRFRLRSPHRVLEEMQRIEQLFGVNDFDLVHDMFTVDRKRVIEFCDFLRKNESHYTWHVSARTDFADRELIKEMHRAGCRSLFFGIETGSSRLQKVIDKGLDVDQSASVLEWAHAAGVRTTASLIVGFPEENLEDLNATAHFGLLSARFDSCRVQFALLAPLAGTPIHRQWRDQLVFDGLLPEVSVAGFALEEADAEFIKRYPELFSSFYGVPAGTGRHYAGEFRLFLKFLLARCRWLAVAIAGQYNSLTQIFNRYLEWKGGATQDLSYYVTAEFAADVCRFVCETLDASRVVSAMAVYYTTLYRILSEPEPASAPHPARRVRLATGIRLADFPFQASRIIGSLQSLQHTSAECFEPATVAFHRHESSITGAQEIPPLAAAMLRHCDGKTPIRQILRTLALHCPAIEGVNPEEFLLQGLRSLERDGLVEIPHCETDEGAISINPFVHEN